jgi:hypothetical protein
MLEREGNAMEDESRIPDPKNKDKFSAADWGRYQWLLSQVTKARVTADGFHIFDLRVSLPPAKTLEDSIDAARRPFVLGQAVTPVWTKITRNRSTIKMVACEPLVIDGYEEFRLGVHQEYGHRFHWQVTEFTSASNVSGSCATKDAAIKKASQRITKYEPTHFRDDLARWRESVYVRSRR